MKNVLKHGVVPKMNSEWKVIDKGSYKEIIRNDKSLFLCPICEQWYRALAYHTTQKHGITGKQLRKILGLKSDYQLITHEIKSRHREIAIENNEAEKLKIVGVKTRFKKGHLGHIKNDWSKQALNELSERHK
jgi:hypothetical protein